ncbi:MAG: hypothetical protein JKY60_12045 [Kordiimonadaceae bacterium]|nr:hypothetical protein [Kordiimonadaceae bacterium]
MKLVQEMHGQALFEKFALVLRYSSFVAVMGCLGMGVTITRKVSEMRANKCYDNLSALILTSAVTVTGLFIVLTIISIVMPKLTEVSSNTVFTILAYSYSLVMFNIAYSVERGYSNFLRTEVSRALYINVPIVPLAIFFENIEPIFWVVTFLNLSWSILFLGARFSLTRWLPAGLLISSLKRFPADFIVPLVWLIPVAYSNIIFGVEAAANLSIAFSVVTASLTLFGPISTLILSDATKIQATIGTRKYARRILTLMVLCLPLFALIHYGFSIAFSSPIDIGRTILFSLLSLSYGACTIFRGLAEALYSYGRFSIILLAAGTGTFLLASIVHLSGYLTTDLLIVSLVIFFSSVNTVLYNSFGRLI